MSLARQVILFIIDGLCPDAVQQAPTPRIDKLIAQGAYTWQAQTVIPSISLPCYASLFLAVLPAHHGVFNNEWRRPQAPIASLIKIVHQAGLGTSAF
jgi:predicted AlkP superfamily pyrophosphatase or phosphodiesterase